MSRKGDPYDNAKTERFIETIKYDEVYMNEYNNFEEGIQNIGNFIEEVYNKKRLHSAIGYMPPAEFEHRIAGLGDHVVVAHQRRLVVAGLGGGVDRVADGATVRREQKEFALNPGLHDAALTGCLGLA